MQFEIIRAISVKLFQLITYFCQRYNTANMKHHEEKEQSLDFVYYLVAMFSGAFIGLIIEKGFTWIVVGAVLGLLTAAFFLNVLVRGRGEKI